MTVTNSWAITFHRSGRPANRGRHAGTVRDAFFQPGGGPRQAARSRTTEAPIARGDGDLCYVEPISDDAKPKLFDRLTLPANAVDVIAEAVITAVISAGRYTPEEQAIIRCIAAAQPDLPLTPEWIAMCLDQARALLAAENDPSQTRCQKRWCGAAGVRRGAPNQSVLMPANLITLAHFSVFCGVA
jgi:hypothetical protein